jgi:redox-sensitive bicupin YhaK (pirin superfamily)
MLDRRPFETLGHADHGWLDARHHFSFASYRAPGRDQWGALRVWNDDQIAPGAGFPMHPHANMEIITYVREGAISHRDSLGNDGVTQAGDVQVMSAGTGITHTEFNAGSDPVRLFQIWLFPEKEGLAPSWGTRPFPKADRSGQFVTLASGLPDDEGALPIRARSRLLGAHLAAGQRLQCPLGHDRIAYLVAATGQVTVNGLKLGTRDGMAIRDELELTIEAITDAELVLVETLI